MELNKSEIKMATNIEPLKEQENELNEKLKKTTISKTGKNNKLKKNEKKLNKKYKGLKWKKTIKKFVKDYPDGSIPVDDLRKMVISKQLSRIEKDLKIIFNEKIQEPTKMYALVGHEVKRLQFFPKQ
ncbi:hypothetical protein DDB_G0275433 [Dictyostelium discoideum AX4]|uniref:Cell growth-regulating nucleolar protein-like winged helix domain-containing protein n=1 Tax=Dictyostelium discoideum TaxID=44689 RepID=Q553P1_DICDI|nr:hypothetical protein DDB_G0275433 [Dictyostelium discoideum AX4]EAL69782.1 hypothetical protein DDB_G0275433 [Dictyostelium discoideum AX4]|eukprot:XP_643705.1 hypothetical protein DDB_G0275433 [Dictyostelium discoideum AX4]